ncbi:hypothetical protein AXG93_4542s1190 [Marchantia polymorpha subsp. ruderalis]|uniref:Uncharacterized protein n=1 Tax=Marchantia polymorpha subsp. ruderalis TaxID=1480154 RepID=A0A176W0J4_MARPO|nr:hypothetical protein AXG93_4542s1190 [Marchantia polymorpha subsp. ruderalis]
MVTTAGLLGAGMGLFVQLYSNGVRKLPLMRPDHKLRVCSLDGLHDSRCADSGHEFWSCGFEDESFDASADPWEHVLAMGLGSAFGNAVVKWEDHLQVQLDKLIEDAKTSNNKRYLGRCYSDIGRHEMFCHEMFSKCAS